MTYVLSDVHGELDRWQRMLQLIDFSDEDTLIVIGDVIDRKKHGVDILLDIMRRPNVFFVRGNHEELMLQTFWGNNDFDARQLWKQNGGGNTYRKMVYQTSTEDRLRILRFIQEAPDELEIEVNGQEFYIVHGYVGQTYHDRIWGRPEPPPKEPPIPGTTVICGHTCTYYLNLYCESYNEDGLYEIFYAPGLICIDCGCGNTTELRRLACLRLDDMAEFYV